MSTWNYGAGATVGAPVMVTFRGLMGHVTGFIPSDAGTATKSGFVAGFNESAIPFVTDLPVLLRETGNREPGDEVLATLCEALTGG